MDDTREQTESAGGTAATPSAVRYPTAIAVGGGLAAAVGSSFIPMNAIEGFVSAYGIAELLPAAAPPLGNTARLALSAGIGTLTAGALIALLPRGETEDVGFESAVKTVSATGEAAERQPEGATGFGASKLAGWLRTLRFGKGEAAAGEVTDFADINRLRMRTGDHHPDAPARAPILASSDLGAPLDSPIAPPAEVALREAVLDAAPVSAESSESGTPEEMMPTPDTGALRPSLRFAAPLVLDAADEQVPPPMTAMAIEEIVGDAEDASAASVPYAAVEPVSPALHTEVAPAKVTSTPTATDLDQLSIGGLLGRLESGLERRRQQAAGRLAPAVRAEHNSGQIIPMAAAVTAVAEAAPSEETARPFRFRLDEMPLPGRDRAFDLDDSFVGDSLPVRDYSWDGEVEYQQPALNTAAAPAAASKDNDSETPAPLQDDDMDAALRDALATLRQLSDRQRNA